MTKKRVVMDMRSIAIVFLSIFSICCVSAWPLDLNINKAIVRLDDVQNFDISLMGNPNYPTSLIVSTIFNVTQKREILNCETCVDGVKVIEEEQPARLGIYFDAPDRYGRSIIDTNGLRFDPVEEIAPKDLVAHGSYNTSLGGLPGTVTWWADMSSGYCIMKMVGLTHDNGTEIAIKSDSTVPNGSVPDEVLKSHNEPTKTMEIAKILTSFNASLKRIELHYLA